MLSIGLISLLITVPLFSYCITPNLFNRITSVILIYSALLSFNCIYIESLASGLSIYSGLFHVTSVSLAIESFLLFVGAFILMGWAPVTSVIMTKKNSNKIILSNSHIDSSEERTTLTPTVSEYSLLILFTTIGASLLISSSNLVSMYLSIELQSFAVYILATLYRNSESSTAAGLKYFLLGGLSSALILLGTAFIYSSTGLTQFESIYTLTQVNYTDSSVFQRSDFSPSYRDNRLSVVLGLVLMGVGFLFKVAAAPFHNWAPDVYDGVPTIVASWLTTMPKISIFVFLLELQIGMEGSIESLSQPFITGFAVDVYSGDTINVWKNLLLMTSLLSLVVGTVVGLSQYRIKRLLAFSTISHVGFILLALAINTEESIESFLFYIIQYSLTNINTFLILLAFGYITHIQLVTIPQKKNNFRYDIPAKQGDIELINDLKGSAAFTSFKTGNPLLGISLALCLFSMAGIPPLIGFFAKQMVLYSSTHAGYYFLSIVAILVSVISASYYLKIIRVIYFDSASAPQTPLGRESNNPFEETYNTTSNSSDNSLNTAFAPSIAVAVSKKIGNEAITTIHSMLISILTVLITLFFLQPSILLNSCHLLALSLFYY